MEFRNFSLLTNETKVMEDNTLLWVLGIGVFLALAYFGYFGYKNKEGKVKDRLLTVERFLEELKKFKMSVNPKRKSGFTEKDVQNELETFFHKCFETVYREYTLEGFNAKQIDFDLGKGKVGIEVKLAREAIKEANWDRALGQLGKYAKKKYTDDNLIVLIAGTEKEKDSQKLKEFQKDIEENGVKYTYVIINNEGKDNG